MESGRLLKKDVGILFYGSMSREYFESLTSCDL
jgi:hypothetical protein